MGRESQCIKPVVRCRAPALCSALHRPERSCYLPRSSSPSTFDQCLHRLCAPVTRRINRFVLLFLKSQFQTKEKFFNKLTKRKLRFECGDFSNESKSKGLKEKRDFNRRHVKHLAQPMQQVRQQQKSRASLVTLTDLQEFNSPADISRLTG